MTLAQLRDWLRLHDIDTSFLVSVELVSSGNKETDEVMIRVVRYVSNGKGERFLDQHARCVDGETKAATEERWVPLRHPLPEGGEEDKPRIEVSVFGDQHKRYVVG